MTISPKKSLVLTTTILVLTLLTVQSTLFPLPGKADTDGSQFLYLEDVQSGMTGTAKTVVKGDEISEFSVEVVDVMDEPGKLEDFIIVRASGKAIERSGGIAQGMSGSPVYIDGKLAGAISRSALWSKNADNPIALVTPIGAMLDLLESGEVGASSNGEKNSVEESLEGFFPGKEVTFETIKVGDSPIYSTEDRLVFLKKQTPIMTNGLSERAFKTLKNGSVSGDVDLIYNPGAPLGMKPLENLNGLSGGDFSFHNSQAASSGEDSSGMEIQPGGPFGVALTEGDVSVGALGTVTYKEENSLLGMGHSFLMTGESDFILNQSKIYDTIKSYQSPFKLGSIGESIGSITQDRAQGVLGEIGDSPDLYETNISVSQEGLESPDEFNTEVVKNPNLISYLSLVTMQESLNKATNRVGQGTVKVEYEITGDNMPEPLTRTDIFFSTNDFSYLPSLQVAVFIDALAFNSFKDPGLTNLTADFSVNNGIQAGQILYFALGNNIYEQGNLVAYEVKIKNYRDDIVRKTGAFKLPENLPPGNYVVSVYGGPRPMEIAPPNPIETFDDLLGYMENLKNYEHLSVELLKPLEESVVPIAGTGYRYESVTRIDKEFTGRVIYGRQAIGIKVIEKQETEEGEAEDE
ncbi:hypothetical protein KGY64_06110 [Candidatus Bipolaricaulota bacterium]|nr:hypothetical protein [Candidatus Bipolaricaulota bacterium]